MTKKDIVKRIAEQTGLTQLKTKEVVQKTFEAIVDILLEDENHRIELRNFGVFMVKTRKSRKARNPRTGEQVPVPAKRVVVFKPGKEMADRIQDSVARGEGREPGRAERPAAAPEPQASPFSSPDS